MDNRSMLDSPQSFNMNNVFAHIMDKRLVKNADYCQFESLSDALSPEQHKHILAHHNRLNPQKPACGVFLTGYVYPRDIVMDYLRTGPDLNILEKIKKHLTILPDPDFADDVDMDEPEQPEMDEDIDDTDDDDDDDDVDLIQSENEFDEPHEPCQLTHIPHALVGEILAFLKYSEVCIIKRTCVLFLTAFSVNRGIGYGMDVSPQFVHRLETNVVNISDIPALRTIYVLEAINQIYLEYLLKKSVQTLHRMVFLCLTTNSDWILNALTHYRFPHIERLLLYASVSSQAFYTVPFTEVKRSVSMLSVTLPPLHPDGDPIERWEMPNLKTLKLITDTPYQPQSFQNAPKLTDLTVDTPYLSVSTQPSTPHHCPQIKQLVFAFQNQRAYPQRTTGDVQQTLDNFHKVFSGVRAFNFTFGDAENRHVLNWQKFAGFCGSLSLFHCCLPITHLISMLTEIQKNPAVLVTELDICTQDSIEDEDEDTETIPIDVLVDRIFDPLRVGFPSLIQLRFDSKISPGTVRNLISKFQNTKLKGMELCISRYNVTIMDDSIVEGLKNNHTIKEIVLRWIRFGPETTAKLGKSEMFRFRVDDGCWTFTYGDKLEKITYGK